SRRAVSTLPPTIRHILAQQPSEASLQAHGWVKSVRKQKRVAFAEVSDGSSVKGLQFTYACRLNVGASVSLTGKLVQSLGKGQALEMRAEDVRLLGACDPEAYPLQKQAHTAEYLREHLHLRSRTNTMSAMLRLRDRLGRSFHDYFQSQDFYNVNTPIFTSSDCEGAGEAFRVTSSIPTSSQGGTPSRTTSELEFFGRPAFLTVSSQLHLEALSSSLARVYTLSPAFRAERGVTHRHLSEFWMLEAELSFCENMEDVMGVVEGLIKHSLNDVRKTCEAELELLGATADADSGSDTAQERRMSPLELCETLGGSSASSSSSAWQRMTYTQAVKELAAHDAASKGASQFQFRPRWGAPLQSEHEKWLAGSLVGGPVFVTDYPIDLKPFYMRLNNNEDAGNNADDTGTVACFDLLIPRVGELVGGSLREERLAHLEHAMKKHGLPVEEYEWYLDLRRFGSVPHGGFGLGFERLVSWVAGIDNIRECIPFPRWPGKMAL
ncbi:hypothetical protein BOTBODRAFT_83896, partial [Botryobasidium botryosum FD-172 SS1]